MTMEICWEGCWAGVVWMDNSSEGGALFFMARGEIEVKRLKFLDSESGLVSPCG